MSSTGDRTTNCYESFHSKFNAEFTSAHPNIYKKSSVVWHIKCVREEW